MIWQCLVLRASTGRQVGDDQYKVIDESGYGVSSNCNWGWNNADITRTEYIEDRTALDDKYDEMKAEWEANIKPSHVLEGFTFDNTNVASQVAAVEANIETYYNPLVNGLVDDVDATIEQFRAALESAGIQDVLDEMERQKEEFIAARQSNLTAINAGRTAKLTSPFRFHF